jgi:5-methylcytosine-specific restriction endonuclease McrA
LPGKKRRKRRTKEQREKYILNYTVGNVSKRTGETRERVLEWLDFVRPQSVTCPFCQHMLRLGTFAVDHKEPISRGGSRLLVNCWLVCQPCNRMKGALTVDEFHRLYAFLSEEGNEFMKKSVLTRMRLGWRGDGV